MAYKFVLPTAVFVNKTFAARSLMYPVCKAYTDEERASVHRCKLYGVGGGEIVTREETPAKTSQTGMMPGVIPLPNGLIVPYFFPYQYEQRGAPVHQFFTFDEIVAAFDTLWQSDDVRMCFDQRRNVEKECVADALPGFAKAATDMMSESHQLLAESILNTLETDSLDVKIHTVSRVASEEYMVGVLHASIKRPVFSRDVASARFFGVRMRVFE